MIRKGLLFDTYDRTIPMHRCPKIIARTGPDYAFSIHYIDNVKTVPVDKSVLQLAHYKMTWRSEWDHANYTVDTRMQRFTERTVRYMKRASMVYDSYLHK